MAPWRSKRQPKKKVPSKDDDVPANTTGTFCSQCGLIVREKIPITVKDWDHVSNGDMEVLWKELKKIF
jgi:hypothetical protein